MEEENWVARVARHMVATNQTHLLDEQPVRRQYYSFGLLPNTTADRTETVTEEIHICRLNREGMGWGALPRPLLWVP